MSEISKPSSMKELALFMSLSRSLDLCMSINSRGLQKHISFHSPYLCSLCWKMCVFWADVLSELYFSEVPITSILIRTSQPRTNEEYCPEKQEPK